MDWSTEYDKNISNWNPHCTGHKISLGFYMRLVKSAPFFVISQGGASEASWSSSLDQCNSVYMVNDLHKSSIFGYS